MSETLKARTKKIWGECDTIIMVAVALVAIMTVAAFSFGGPSPRDVAIKEIAELQRTAVAQQFLTNQLLRDLIKAQERK